jgi:hypothetical protein
MASVIMMRHSAENVYANPEEHPLERGVYFDAWFPRQHCYHPSLPPRRLRMVDELEDYRATSLVWSALGGGSLSLPYLEQEAFGEVDPRFRFYGFVNDAEFIAECRRRGIKVFGIVFEVQGWEFAAELSEDEDRVLSLNEVRGAGKRAWLGLREFSQNRYPRLWKPVEHYFPDGLVNSEGERVTDLIEECVSRDIHGNACHARWVEVPDNPHECYLMDRNNPVWREYLKAIIRIQIDAGVDGIQLDEAETPLTALMYGGCFCRECMKGFNEFLAEERPAELEGVDLGDFHYGRWLLERGFDFKEGREQTPLFWEYHRYQQRQITRYFAELASYAREYAKGKGREVLVSGNFFNLFDHYYPLEREVDVVITEMRNTTYRQPDWYRYVAGFAGDKPVIVVENPYGGVVPELIEMLGRGRGYDLFRMSLYEAAALGVNMSVPYGSWMGSVIEDAFYAPHELCVEIQSFLADHERLYSRATYHEVAVVYSIPSSQQLLARRAAADNRTNETSDVAVPFLQACESLTAARHPYDVVLFPEGELRPDELQLGDLRRYRTLVLPDCHRLTERQAELLLEYLEDGGRLVASGALGENLDEEPRRALLEHAGTTRAEAPAGFGPHDLPDGPQVRVHGGDADMALCVQRVEAGAAVHLIRYDYDAQTDAVTPLTELELELRLPELFSRATAFTPAGESGVSLVTDGETHRLRLTNVPLHVVVLLER